jgi:hypothetical protein
LGVPSSGVFNLEEVVAEWMPACLKHRERIGHNLFEVEFAQNP